MSHVEVKAIKFIALRKFPELVDVPDKFVGELPEEDMRTVFEGCLKLDAFDDKRTRSVINKGKMTVDEHIEAALRTYDRWLKEMKTRVRVGVVG